MQRNVCKIDYNKAHIYTILIFNDIFINKKGVF